jgi:hypothetical protein
MIRRGTLLEWKMFQGDPCKEQVLGIEADGAEVWAIDLEDEKAEPILHEAGEITAALESGRARIIDRYDRYVAILVPGDKYFEKHKEKAQKNYLLIAEFAKDTPRIFNRHERRRLIKQASHKSGVCVDKLRRLLRQFWQGGCTSLAMMPKYHRCGQTPGEDRKDHGKKRGRKSKRTILTGEPTGRNLTAEDKKKFAKGIADFVTKGRSQNLQEAFQLILEKYFNVGFSELKDGTKVPILPPRDECPTFWQFEHHYRKTRDPKSEIIGREGVIVYEQENRPILDDSRKMAFGPGSVYQIDATVGDIYLVNYLNRKLLIGRPIIYLVVDVFSGLIAGLAITLEGPNWEGASLALECAFMNKVEYCRALGIEITQEMWDVEGYCEALLGDNGEMAGYNPNSLVDPFGIRVSNAAPFRPDWKAIVERKFRTIRERGIVWLPGAVRPRRHVGGPDYRLEAMLDLNQFRKLMVTNVINYNNTHYMKKYRMRKFMIADDVEPIPAKLWNYYLGRLTGKLRTNDPDVIRLNLLRRGMASITPMGIRFNQIYYTCETAMREQWFTREKGRKTKHVEIVHGSRVEDVHLRLRRGRAFEQCVLTPADQRFTECDWYDVEDYFARIQQAAQDYEPTFRQAMAGLHAQANRIVNEGTAMTRRALAGDTRSKKERTGNIRENRKALKAHERKYGPHAIQPSDVSRTETSIPADSLSTPPASVGYIPPAQPFDELRQSRERRKKR